MSDAQPDADARPLGGQLLAAISNNMVRILAEYTGRGPTRARTVINGDWVFITLEDALTKGERKLGEIGRHVVAFMSDNHIDPDVGLEALLLEPEDAAAGEQGGSGAASG